MYFTSNQLRGSVAEWLWCWNCDQQVADSNPRRRAVECNPGQVVYTHVPLSPSSIIWYQPMAGWEGNCRSGIALVTRHRHQWFSSCGLRACKRKMSSEHPPTLCTGICYILMILESVRVQRCSSAIVSISEVTVRRAGLVLTWWSVSLCNQPPRLTHLHNHNQAQSQ